MVTKVLPDTEAIAIAYLLTRPEVTDLVGGPPASDARIGSTLDLTKDTALPALRVSRIGTTSPVRRHLRAGNVQLEAFAVDTVTAQDLLETAVAVLHEEAFPGVFAGLGVVTGVVEAIGPRPQSDPDTDTPRWLGSVVIYAHPEP